MNNHESSTESRSTAAAWSARRCIPVGFGFLSALLVALPVGAQSSQRATETLTVSFSTMPTLSPRYAPKNVLVVWVEDSSGTFVKTVGRWAGQRYASLVNWTAKAGYDTDAVTGATRSSHSGTPQVVWDMKNKAGQTVPDGTYRICLELADRDNPSPTSNNLGTFTFVKNGTASVQSTSGSRFSNVSIEYSGRSASYSLTVNANAGGSILLPATSPGIHEGGAVVAIQAAPSAGYVFAGWSGSSAIGSPGSAATTVQMLADTVLTASFTDLDEQFAVSTTAVTVPEGGSASFAVSLTAQPTATVTANVDYVSGDTDISSATRAQLQFTTATWHIPQTVTLSATEDADASAGVAKFQLADAAASLASVDLTVTEADDDYLLSLAASPPEAGSVSPAGTTVQEGAPAAVVSISATAGLGWVFVGWTGDVTQVAHPEAAATTVTMGAACSLTASFEPVPCVLTVSAGSGGHIQAPAQETSVHDYGSVVNLVAVPDLYQEFDQWVGSTGEVADVFAASTTIAITADTAVQATFREADDDGDGLPDAWEARYFTLIAEQNGEGNPDFDLLTNAEEYALGSDPTKTTLLVTAGWNLLTVPRTPAVGTTYADQLSGLSYVSVWGWSATLSRYYDVTRAPAGENLLSPLEGYWVFALADGWTDVEGVGFPSGDRELQAGWNLAGPLVGGGLALPPEVSPVFWGWDGSGYVGGTQLYPTLGVWIYCSQPTTVTLP